MKKKILAITVFMVIFSTIAIVSCSKDDKNTISKNSYHSQSKFGMKVLATWTEADGLMYTTDIDIKLEQCDSILNFMCPDYNLIMEDYQITDDFPQRESYSPILTLALYNITDTVGYVIGTAIEKAVEEDGTVVYYAPNGDPTIVTYCKNNGCRKPCRMTIKRDSNGRVQYIYCEACRDDINILKPAAQKCEWASGISITNNNNNFSLSSLF